VGDHYETCFMSQLWCLKFLDRSLILGKFVHDWYGGVVVYLHLFVTSTLDWIVNCSLLNAAALFPRDAARDTALIGGREGHRSRLDALENWRSFAFGRESNRATQSAAYMKFPASSRTEHQSCM